MIYFADQEDKAQRCSLTCHGHAGKRGTEALNPSRVLPPEQGANRLRLRPEGFLSTWTTEPSVWHRWSRDHVARCCGWFLEGGRGSQVAPSKAGGRGAWALPPAALMAPKGFPACTDAGSSRHPGGLLLLSPEARFLPLLREAIHLPGAAQRTAWCLLRAGRSGFDPAPH